MQTQGIEYPEARLHWDIVLQCLYFTSPSRTFLHRPEPCYTSTVKPLGDSASTSNSANSSCAFDILDENAIFHVLHFLSSTSLARVAQVSL